MAQPHREAGPGVRVGSASLGGCSVALPPGERPGLSRRGDRPLPLAGSECLFWLLRRRHAHDPEAEADVADAGVEPQPASGAAILRGVIPRAAAQDALPSPVRTRGVL